MSCVNDVTHTNSERIHRSGTAGAAFRYQRQTQMYHHFGYSQRIFYLYIIQADGNCEMDAHTQCRNSKKKNENNEKQCL